MSVTRSLISPLMLDSIEFRIDECDLDVLSV